MLTQDLMAWQRQALKLVLLVEDGVWPEYTLHEQGTWAAHRKFLSLEQRHAEVRREARAARAALVHAVAAAASRCIADGGVS